MRKRNRVVLRLRIFEVRFKRRHPRVPRLRWLAMAGLMFVAACLPTAYVILRDYQYRLDDQVKALVGSTSPGLAQKFSYDGANKQWQFNKDSIEAAEAAQATANGGPASPADVAKALQAKVGGGEGAKDESLYAVNLPEDGKQGVTYYDANTHLSFDMVPQFKVKQGREVSGQLIYPMNDGAKLIYTAKGNGMKEDIILTKPLGDKLRFTYTLDLGKYLEAKILDDGSVGVYSPDPILFGDMSFGGDNDREKIMSARENATRDHLLFAIPAPIIKQTKEAEMPAKAYFQLDGDNLQVYAEGLSKLTYPITVDPSVVVTSSADFESGNNESNIDFSSGAIGRGALTGGSVGSWTSTASNPYTARMTKGTVAYNGYIYVVGGLNGSGASSDVSYAQLNSNGTVGAWASTTSLPAARAYPGVVAYNGYLYAYGGYTSGTSALNTLVYAPLASTGTVGTWTASSNTMGTAVCRAGAAVYGGYIYSIGGATGTVATDCGNSSATNTGAVQYAALKGNGDTGSWSSSANTVTARKDVGVVAYNGFIYAMGGTTDGSSTSTTVQFAGLKSTGDITSWTTSTVTITGNYRFGLTAYKGYLYLVGGNANGTSVSYASIGAGGEIGSFSTTTAMSVSRYGLGVVGYNGYIYITGGYDNPNTTYLNSTIYAAIESAGKPGSFATSGNTFTTTRRGAETVIYGNYMYVLGGDNGSTPVNTIYKALIDSTTGTIGSFASEGTFTTARTFFAAVAYNDYMYVLGGCSSAYSSCTTASNNVATVYKAPINPAAGAIGAWSAQTSFTTARYGLSAVVYNNYIYVMGGLNGSTFQNDIQYHAFGASGAISGAWTTSAKTISTARAYFGATVYGGRLYIAGGCSAGALTCTTAQNDIQYASLATSGDLSANLTSNGTSFSNTRGGHEIVAWAGNLYVTGGWDGSTYYADTQFAPIGTTGAVGTWALGTGFSNARYGIGAAGANGYLYVTGGYNGTTYYNNVQIATLNGTGIGSPLGFANGSTISSCHNRFAGAAVYNGYLYQVGGRCGPTNTDSNVVSYVKLNEDGTQGTWADDAHTFTTARQLLAAAAYNGYLYVIGGYNGNSTYYNDVQYAPIGSSGALTGNFASAGGNFAATGQQGPCVQAYNGYMYTAGGWNGITDSADVRYAAINSNGTLGTWGDAGNDFTNGRSNGGCFIANGKFYIVGGEGAAKYNDVQYATINSNGTIGSFTYTTGMNIGKTDFYVGYSNGFVYAAGGLDSNNTSLFRTEFAPVNANGTLGEWQFGVQLPTDGEAASGAIYNGHMYLFANSASTAYFWYSKLMPTPRTAKFSKLINLGAPYSLQSIAYNGSLPGGLTSIVYKTADSTGVFGSATSSSSLSGGTTPTCTSGDAYYVWVQVTLDDATNMAVYGDGDGTRASITDMTVYYTTNHAAPNLRLAHGKFFTNESLQGLDVCGS